MDSGGSYNSHSIHLSHKNRESTEKKKETVRILIKKKFSMQNCQSARTPCAVEIRFEKL